MSTIPVITKGQSLPFGDLNFENFELLCRRIIKFQGDNITSRNYGQVGERQRGIDIYAVKKDGKLVVYECKNRKKFGPQSIKSTVEKFISADWGTDIQEFVLCTRINLRSIAQNNEIIRQTKILQTLGIRFQIWDAQELNDQLKTLPEIVYDFFGNTWAEHFCGDIFLKFKNGVVSPDSLVAITEAYFDNEKFSSQHQRNAYSVNYYTYFNNDFNHLSRVVANDLYVKPDDRFNFIFSRTKKRQSATISEVLSDNELFTSSILINISSLGGTGKSTLLWHFIRMLSSSYKVCYLKAPEIAALTSIYDRPNIGQPVLLFIDDILKDHTKHDLVSFAEKISLKSLQCPTALFFTERSFLYSNYSQRKRFEDYFEKVLELDYTNETIRDRVFENVINSVFPTHKMNLSIQRKCLTKFNEYRSEGLTDAIYNFLTCVNKEAIISYKFEWDEWEESCIGKYQIFKPLFGLVAFFYQFRIELPISFVKDYFSLDAVPDFLLSQLLGRFDDTKSPIIINYENESLKLRHEKIAEWFFKISDPERFYERDIFKNFINTPSGLAGGYIFRNLFRKNSEFESTQYYSEVSAEQKLFLVDQYLERFPRDDFSDDRSKMLMTKHFFLLDLNRKDEAIQELVKILKNDVNNIYALTLLASYFKVIQPLKAEKYLLKALAISPNEVKPKLFLFSLYHNNRFESKLQNLQQQLLELCETDSFFAYSVILFIRKTFHKIEPETRNFLKEIQINNIGLRLRILDLFIVRRYFLDAKQMLSNLGWRGFGLLSKIETAEMAISIYENDVAVDLETLAMAKNILNSTGKGIKKARVRSLFAKIASLQGTNNQEILESYLNALNADRRNLSLLKKICELYIRVAFKMQNFGDQIDLLTKAKNLIQRTRKSLDQRDGRTADLYLLYVLVKEVEIHIINFKDINDQQKTECRDLIGVVATELHSFIDSAEIELRSKLASGSVSSRISNYFCSATCTLATFHRVILEGGEGKLESFWNIPYPDLTPPQAIIGKALQLIPNQPDLILEYVKSLIRDRDESIVNQLKGFSYRDFNNIYKFRLADYFYKLGLAEEMQVLYQKWHYTTSTKLTVKKHFAHHYIFTEHWGYAIQTMSELNFVDRDVYRTFQDLLLKIPGTITFDLHKKLHLLLEQYLILYPLKATFIRAEICKNLFLHGRLRESKEVFFTKIIAKFQTNNFGEFTGPFIVDFLKNLRKRTLKIHKKYPLRDVSLLFDSLFEIDYDFDSITLPAFNNVDIEINGIVRICLNKLFEQLISSSSQNDDIIYFFKVANERYANSYIVRTILIRLLDKGYKKAMTKGKYYRLLIVFLPFIERLEAIFERNLDIRIFIANYYLNKGTYGRCNENLQFVCKNHSRTVEQEGRCLIGFADITIAKIENGLIPEIDDIYRKLINAEQNLIKAQKLYPEYSSFTERFESIERLKPISPQ